MYLEKIVRIVGNFLWRLTNAIKFAVSDYDAKLRVNTPLWQRIVIWSVVFGIMAAVIVIAVVIILKFFNLVFSGFIGV
ncbi:MAG: hypothetical protein HYW86_04280 [Candidatus Roizmanbacteria bacterium]|nr:MAG: hypothetical protein HYW86_04280 [Candidatus Roizmanbacteria bacterium]